MPIYLSRGLYANYIKIKHHMAVSIALCLSIHIYLALVTQV